MRPRVFPAEDASMPVTPPPPPPASMRPRVFPAEDGDAEGLLHPHQLRFNEAAGIPRGRRRSTAMSEGQDGMLQ